MDGCSMVDASPPHKVPNGRAGEKDVVMDGWMDGFTMLDANPLLEGPVGGWMGGWMVRGGELMNARQPDVLDGRSLLRFF